MAPKPKDIDEAQVIDLARICCTDEEIAAVLHVSHDTLARRFRAVIDAARHEGKQSLRRKQYQVAMDDDAKGQATMLVWLGKNLLGQKDSGRVEITGNDGGPVRLSIDPRRLPDDVLDALEAATGDCGEPT